MSINRKIVNDFIKNKIEFVTTVPCKQLAGVIDEIEAPRDKKKFSFFLGAICFFIFKQPQ